MSAARSLAEMITPRRLVTTALLLLAAVVSVVGLQSVRDTRAASCSHGVIAKLYPCPGDTDLRQGQIGVEMAQGWQAELYVDNTAIPKDQVAVQGTGFFYTPGPGSASALAPGHHTVRVVYYLSTTGEASSQQYAWNFSTS